MEPKKGPIKVPVRDKRRNSEASAQGSAVATDASSSRSSEGAAAQQPTPPAEASSEEPVSSPSSASASTPAVNASEKRDYEDLYLRAVADLENERKRFKIRESERAERSVRALIEALLPVLDNFERAIAHGEGGEGVALVFKQLAAVLEGEGVEEMAAEGAEFDPNLHEAVESRVQAGLEIPTVIEVHRRGYLLNGQLLRAALVVVGRPEEAEEEQV